MANTFTQIHFQFIFSPKFRQAVISPAWEKDLQKYIAGILKAKGHKPLAINGTEDHIHIFYGHNPADNGITKIVQDIKRSTSLWINENRLTSAPFKWQNGFGDFSYKKSDVSCVITYIENQKEHHKKFSFLEEYKKYLEKFEIVYNELYIFKEPE